jgi:hypothetical protein
MYAIICHVSSKLFSRTNMMDSILNSYAVLVDFVEIDNMLYFFPLHPVTLEECPTRHLRYIVDFLGREVHSYSLRIEFAGSVSIHILSCILLNSFRTGSLILHSCSALSSLNSSRSSSRVFSILFNNSMRISILYRFWRWFWCYSFF